MGQIIRHAIREDVDQITVICRRSFPNTFRWKVNGSLARKWFQAAILSRAVEMWVVEENKRIAAICVLVTDEFLWAKEKNVRRGSNMDILYGVLRSPLAASRQACQSLKCVLKRNGKVTLHQQMPDGWAPEIRTWIELIAVRPDRRSEGLAGMFLGHCDVKTQELGRKAIAVRVASENYAAKSLYEKHGYVCYRSDQNGELYMRFVEE